MAQEMNRDLNTSFKIIYWFFGDKKLVKIYLEHQPILATVQINESLSRWGKNYRTSQRTSPEKRGQNEIFCKNIEEVIILHTVALKPSLKLFRMKPNLRMGNPVHLRVRISQASAF